MRNPKGLTRRQLLTGSASVGAATLAGCQGIPFLGGGGSQVIEGFEGTLSAWNMNNGAGSGSGIQEDVTRSGTGALEIVNVGGVDCSLTSLPGDGLDQYPSMGDGMSIWGSTEGGNRPTIGFCYLWQDVGSYTQNDGSGYAARIKLHEDSIELVKVVDGNSVVTESAGTESPLSADEWYRFVVDTTADGTHEFTLETANGTSLASTTMTDTEWESGGFGVAYNGNRTAGLSAYWDDLAIES